MHYTEPLSILQSPQTEVMSTRSPPLLALKATKEGLDDLEKRKLCILNEKVFHAILRLNKNNSFRFKREKM